jgi:hypothetical protein
MTSKEFNLLGLQERSDVILEWAYYLSNRKNNDENRVLFSVFGFFAEMTLRISDNQVVEVKAFEKGEDLKDLPVNSNGSDPFLNAILNPCKIDLFNVAA